MHHRHDAQESHGHGEVFYATPIVNNRVFELIRDALRRAVADDQSRARGYEESLSLLEAGFAELDRLVRVTWRVAVGEPEASRELRNWLEIKNRAREVVTDHRHAEDGGDGGRRDDARNAGYHDRGGLDSVGHVIVGNDRRAARRAASPTGPRETSNHVDHEDYDEFGVTRWLRGAPILGLFIGAAFVAFSDDQLRERYVETIRVDLQRHIGVLDKLQRHSSDYLDGVSGPRNLLDFFDELGDAPVIPLIPNELDDCFRSAQRRLGRGSALATAMRQMERAIDPNTARITGVSPNPVCAGQTLTITPAPGMPFDAASPAGVGVLFSRCGVAGENVNWLPNKVTVTVPAAAQTGQVYFGDLPTLPVSAAMEDLSGILSSCSLFATMAGRGPMMAVYERLPISVCSDELVALTAANAVTVQHPPTITAFRAVDANNTEIGSRPVEPGSNVTVHWEVTSDAPGTTAVRVLAGNGVLLSGLAEVAAATIVAAVQTETLTLEARNSCGTSTLGLSIVLVRRLTLQPANLRLQPGQQATLTLSTSVASNQQIVVVVVTTNSQTVAIANGVVVIPPGQTTPVHVTGITGGLPDHSPAATISAGRIGYESAGATVWVDKPSGDHAVVAFGPHDPAQPKIDVVAVHAATTASGKILLFSYDENDWAHLDKAKSALWDPASKTSQPVNLGRNLFCAGHCFLGDGRLLVAGGQSTAQRFAATIGSFFQVHQLFFGSGADHDIHTYDAATESWSRHQPDMPGARWYPTCTTLPNGQALIVAGYADHAVSSMNTDYEIFDGAQNKLISRHQFVSTGLYPFVHVLPGGTLFVHSADQTMLLTLDNTTQEPIIGQLAPFYSNRSLNTRTYNGQGASAILPFDPDRPTRVRVLVVGGGGAPDGQVTRTTPASNTAEIFDFDPSTGSLLGQGGWRVTADQTLTSKPQTFLTTPRFMADAVLLPDGTVAVVGGAGAGIADDVGGPPVMWVESFDPETEKFTAMSPLTVPRLYHSCALLIADGSVIIAGSTGSWFSYEVGGGLTNEFRLEMYYPPYLYRGPRPTFTLTAAEVFYGQPFDIVVTSGDTADIEQVLLLRLGSTTHTNNMDQRNVGLKITARTADTLHVLAPDDGSIAPPGPYLLFLSKGIAVTDRIPSVGTHVMVRS